MDEGLYSTMLLGGRRREKHHDDACSNHFHGPRTAKADDRTAVIAGSTSQAWPISNKYQDNLKHCSIPTSTLPATSSTSILPSIIRRTFSLCSNASECAHRAPRNTKSTTSCVSNIGGKQLDILSAGNQSITTSISHPTRRRVHFLPKQYEATEGCGARRAANRLS